MNFINDFFINIQCWWVRKNISTLVIIGTAGLSLWKEVLRTHGIIWRVHGSPKEVGNCGHQEVGNSGTSPPPYKKVVADMNIIQNLKRREYSSSNPNEVVTTSHFTQYSTSPNAKNKCQMNTANSNNNSETNLPKWPRRNALEISQVPSIFSTV